MELRLNLLSSTQDTSLYPTKRRKQSRREAEFLSLCVLSVRPYAPSSPPLSSGPRMHTVSRQGDITVLEIL